MILWPIHPKLVHFPIALFITAFILDILSRISHKDSLFSAAVIIYIVGTLFTPFVVWAGLWEQQRLNLHHPVLEQHKLLGFMSMWLSVISLPVLWLLKKGPIRVFKLAFTGVLLSVVILVSAAGYMGGRMVYEYGAGVQGT